MDRRLLEAPSRARSLFELLPDSVHSNTVAVELSITRRTKRAGISDRRSVAHWWGGFRSQIYVATTDEKMHVYHLKGKRVSTFKTPALVTQLEVLQARYRNCCKHYQADGLGFIANL